MIIIQVAGDAYLYVGVALYTAVPWLIVLCARKIILDDQVNQWPGLGLIMNTYKLLILLALILVAVWAVLYNDEILKGLEPSNATNSTTNDFGDAVKPDLVHVRRDLNVQGAALFIIGALSVMAEKFFMEVAFGDVFLQIAKYNEPTSKNTSPNVIQDGQDNMEQGLDSRSNHANVNDDTQNITFDNDISRVLENPSETDDDEHTMAGVLRINIHKNDNTCASECIGNLSDSSLSYPQLPRL